jgi:type II secretory pathway pseudopilin PulG
MSDKDLEKSGFTLLELSIILVIIGLLVGGVLIGSEMIKQSQLSRVTKDFQKYETLYQTFILKYNAIAGDFPRASQYWPSCMATATDCDGDGDGLIEGSPRYEMYLLWRHFNLAGMVPGNFSGVAETPEVILNKNLPTAPLDGSGYILRYNTNSIYGKQDNGLSLSSMPSCNGALNGPSLNAADAQSIDFKADDGLAATGNIRATIAPVPSGPCATLMSGCISGTVYDLGNPTVSCRLFYWFE